MAGLDAECDTLSVEEFGRSLDDNPLHAATVGTGGRSIPFVTQQHGDEPVGTEAAMILLDFLAEDTEVARAIREEVTIAVAPRVNPDGFARWEREAGGERGLVDPRVNSEGIDLNRTDDPAAPFSADIAPESVAVRARGAARSGCAARLPRAGQPPGRRGRARHDVGAVADE
jgi:murein tripeptide amidase MpaA